MPGDPPASSDGPGDVLRVSTFKTSLLNIASPDAQILFNEVLPNDIAKLKALFDPGNRLNPASCCRRAAGAWKSASRL
jgi:hypothetical protein